MNIFTRARALLAPIITLFLSLTPLAFVHAATVDPTLTLSVDRSTIPSGGTVTFTWAATNVTTCNINGSGNSGLGAWPEGNKPLSGSEKSGPLVGNAIYGFSLDCSGPNGEIIANIHVRTVVAGDTRTYEALPTKVVAIPVATVTVFAAAKSSFGSSFVVSGQPIYINPGESAKLTWLSNHATRCDASVYSETTREYMTVPGWTTNIATSNSVGISTGALKEGQYAFDIVCEGPGGRGRDTMYINVGPHMSPVPTISIFAYPAFVNLGASTTIRWLATSVGTGSCNASGDWSGVKDERGTESTPVFTTIGKRTYSLTCTTAFGDATTSSAVVDVIKAVEPTPDAKVTMTASPVTIKAGESAMLSWSSTNANYCEAAQEWSGFLDKTGTKSTGILTTPGIHIFAISCHGSGASPAFAGATVNVATGTGSTLPDPKVRLEVRTPYYNLITYEGYVNVGVGQYANLTWASDNADSCTASGNWTGERSVRGLESTGTFVSPGQYTYVLTCKNAAGKIVSDTALVNVSPAGTTAPPTSPVAPTAPSLPKLSSPTTGVSGISTISSVQAPQFAPGNDLGSARAALSSYIARLRAQMKQNTTAQSTNTPGAALALPSGVTKAANTCVGIVHNLGQKSTDNKNDNDVTVLQSFLVAGDYLNATPTGYYGTMTTKAVKSFQKKYGIEQTGTVGPKTKAKIKDLTCP